MIKSGDLSLGNKIVIDLTILILVFSAAGYIVLKNFTDSSHLTEEVFEKDIKLLSFTDLALVNMYSLMEIEEEIEELKKSGGVISDELLGKYSTKINTISSNLGVIIKKSDIKKDSINLFVKKLERHQKEILNDNFLIEGEMDHSSIFEGIELLNSLSVYANNNALNAKDDLHEKFEEGMDSIYFAIFISSIVSIFIGFMLFRMVTKPLKSMIKVAESIKNNDLSVNIDENILNRKDEYGKLARTFKSMKENLKDMIENIETKANDLSSISQKLNNSFSEIGASAEEVTSSMEEINKGAAILTKSVNETKNETLKLTGSARNIQNVVIDSSISVDLANREAKKGEGKARIANQNIQKINALAETSTKSILELDDQINEVSSVMEIITSISDQTNLLALNAAIEAARAGEQGKGFAVVADEVRKLAEQTKTETHKIENMVKNIITNSGNVIEVIKTQGKQTKESTESVNEAVLSLNQITRCIADIVESFSKIKIEINSQNAISKTVEKSVTEVSSVAEESAASSNQVSLAMGDTDQSINGVLSTIKFLSKSSKELKDSIHKFRK